MTQPTYTSPSVDIPLTEIESYREDIERLARSDLPISGDAKQILDLLTNEEENE